MVRTFLATLLVSIVAWLPCSASAQSALGSGPVNASQAREQFTTSLHERAKARAAPGTPEYFAIIRRGLDAFDAAAHATRQLLRNPFDDSFLGALDVTPTPFDADRNGQRVTMRRLGINSLNIRITNGLPVQPGVSEEVVAVVGKSGLCTGIALNATTVLTAAHCVCDLALNSSADGSEKLVFVSHDINQDTTREFPIDVDKTTFFPTGYVCGEANVASNVAQGKIDLARIKLKDGFAMANLPPVQLATVQQLESSIAVDPIKFGFEISGFGCTQPIQTGGRFQRCSVGGAGAKMFGLLSISYQCASGPGGLVRDDSTFGDPSDVCTPGAKEFVLTAYVGGPPSTATDTCQGDSGGPVLLTSWADPSKPPVSHLVGITSRALHPGGICGFGGIYVKVADDNVLAWLGGN